LPILGRGMLFILGVVVALGSRPASAEDLDAGKSGPRLFASNCSGCHRSPKGLAKGHSAGSLQAFLRQHYSTGPATAAELATYLAVAVGDSRRVRQRAGVGDEPPAAARSRAAKRNESGDGREPEVASPRRPRATTAGPSISPDKQRREHAARPSPAPASAEPATKPQPPAEAVHAVEPSPGGAETVDHKSTAPSTEAQPDQPAPAAGVSAPPRAQTAAASAEEPSAPAEEPSAPAETPATGEISPPNSQPTFSAPSP
jgi:hypothetical protein